ncbi:hypothetical protein Bca52824_018438 [Brassica carinata]|uniref:Uncharacterized protein n=1 Tax=Brassica carinata TaxID=52824 RepID=A0A8X7VPR4_BRACI|nr:hypothetical protein Bca52824_018438 [Brassica carinata]
MNGKDPSLIPHLPLGFSVVPVNQPHVLGLFCQSGFVFAHRCGTGLGERRRHRKTPLFHYSHQQPYLLNCLPYLLRSRKSSAGGDSAELKQVN